MVRGFGSTLLTTIMLAGVCVVGFNTDGATQSMQVRSGTVTNIKLAQANQLKRTFPAARPVPVVRPAPIARPAIPLSRPAPIARPAGLPRQTPAARYIPAVPQAPSTFTAPRTPARVVGPQYVSPTVTPNVGDRSYRSPTVVGPTGTSMRAMSIQGASRATISGRNFSIWRGSYRAYRGGYWRTFVGVGTLGAILYGGYRYYPYAYIDAPSEFCEGDTEDGCQLQWQQVQTLEGPADFQCVAYCPWQ